MPQLIDRLAAYLQVEAGHEAGTARDIAANTVRKWWAAGSDHRGRDLPMSVVEAARGEVVAFERNGSDLAEAAALAVASARAGGRTLKNAQRRELAERLSHRKTLAEGLLLALRTDRGREQAERLLGGKPKGDLAEALRAEALVCSTLLEGLGYGRHPIRGDGGKFHGMHGREKASRTARMMPDPGAEKCPSCSAAIPSKDSSCPSCGWVPEQSGKDGVLEKLAEATATAATAAAGGTKAAAKVDTTPAAAPAKPSATKGGELGAKYGGPGAAKAPATAKPETPDVKTRTGAEQADPEFEQQHPRAAKGRTGGGRWIQKGAGMQAGPSNLVRQAQQRLAEIDPKYATQPDGKFGDHTEDQIRAFQKDMGLQETGMLDPPTVEAMRNPPRDASGNLRSAGAGAGAAGAASGDANAGAQDPMQMPDPSDPDAIKAWQTAHGLPESGLVDKATQAAMRAVKSATARAGASSSGKDGQRSSGSYSGTQMIRRGDGMQGQPDENVKDLQTKLDGLGFDLGGGVDGRFGEGTQAAIEKLQRKYGLRVDGVAGVQTLDLIDRLQKESGKSGLTEAIADHLGRMFEATYHSVGPAPNFGTVSAAGGVVPVVASDPQLVATVVERQGNGAINFRPDMTEGAKMDLQQRLAEARSARVAAEKSGDSTAWARARERETAAMAELEEVKSSAYPGLDRSPKKNWVDKAGGLPKYIERIAKHLHYEKGKEIGNAIAIAVNVVKRMCSSGDTNFPGKQSVNPKSRAEACAAVASWEKKKGSAKTTEAAAEDEFEKARELVEALPTAERFYPSLEQAWNIARDMEDEERRVGSTYLEMTEAVLETKTKKRMPPPPPDEAAPDEEDAELMALVEKFVKQGMPRDAAMKAAKKALAAKAAGEGE